jgi:hypothetical protein
MQGHSTDVRRSRLWRCLESKGVAEATPFFCFGFCTHSMLDTRVAPRVAVKAEKRATKDNFQRTLFSETETATQKTKKFLSIFSAPPHPPPRKKEKVRNFFWFFVHASLRACPRRG